MQGEAAGVIVGTIARVRNTGLSSGSKRESFGEYIKITQFYIGCSGSRCKGNDFLLNCKGSHPEQNKNTPFPGARTMETGARVKISPSDLPESVNTPVPQRDIILTALAGRRSCGGSLEVNGNVS